MFLSGERKRSDPKKTFTSTLLLAFTSTLIENTYIHAYRKEKLKTQGEEAAAKKSRQENNVTSRKRNHF